MALYKYLSLSNPRRFIEILLNEKLYGALFDELNDPMEGYFNYSKDVSNDVRKEMANIRKNTCICSFSRRNNIGVMWTHYADSHKGVCLELEIKDAGWERVDVNYNNNILCAQCLKSPSYLFKRKTTQWEYEEETRYIKTKSINNHSQSEPKGDFVAISIIQIYLGMNMSLNESEYWKKLIKRVLPNIKVTMMGKDDVDFGYEVSTMN